MPEIPPVLTREQVRRVDQLAVDRYHMSGLVLMENAGRNAAQIIQREYSDAHRVVTFCGTGNNGGDGWVIARHLHNAGWEVRGVVAGDPARMTPDTVANWRIADAMGIPILQALDRKAQQDAVASIDRDEVLVDALLGTGFHGNVREPTASTIESLNAVSRRSLVAIDVPSGLDCDTGRPGNVTIRADMTITFVANKRGFREALAKTHVGQVIVADIGAPRELICNIAAEADTESTSS